MSEREQPDPGDGWRLLEVGDVIQAGDEFYSFREWHLCSRFAEVVSGEHLPIRRASDLPQPDLVNAPPHYRQGDIECIDAIRAALTEEEFRGYLKGNALKYVWRERHKGGDQDLRKAEWYLSRIETELSQ